MKRILMLAIFLGAWNPAPAQDSAMGEKEARRIVQSMRAKGRVGGSLDLRVTSTDKSYNYKLRATWFTPGVLRAVGRLLEISKGLSPSDVEKIM